MLMSQSITKKRSLSSPYLEGRWKNAGEVEGLSCANGKRIAEIWRCYSGAMKRWRKTNDSPPPP